MYIPYRLCISYRLRTANTLWYFHIVNNLECCKRHTLILRYMHCFLYNHHSHHICIVILQLHQSHILEGTYRPSDHFRLYKRNLMRIHHICRCLYIRHSVQLHNLHTYCLLSHKTTSHYNHLWCYKDTELVILYQWGTFVHINQLVDHR